MSVNGSKPHEGVKSAERVLDLLEFFGCARRPLALFEVTQELGIPKSSALALLRTLAMRGYVARDAEDRYALAHPFGQEEGDWLGGLSRQVAAVARPVIAALVARTQETVNLGVLLNSLSVRLLVQVPSPREIRYEPGSADCPAYCTAMGRVLLAHAPEAVVDRCLAPPLAALTPATETDPRRIRALIAAARAQGFAEIESEYAEGGAGVAAAVFDRTGRAVAALNLASLTDRFHRERAAYAGAVVEAAAAITARLGGAARAPLAVAAGS
ncbi:IclR family transcriptional regulator [Roseomonas sp. 18066]|uniref:IclR family transcriptional regulator n=1 Tax=Roseomonas sp. 18066 TaxID=2681412 RepID=UPI001356A01D|nr:IclR family transcriptional regulator C-terminal domain-containing protein [Roseomonas sp. 18066]